MAAATNPNPALITDAVWSVWTGFDAHEPSALLGGAYALKRGYHSTRRDNQLRWPDDYSIRLAADLRGPSDKAAALDLTMSTAAMIRVTKRLDVAARAKDPRLYRDGKPILREFIGTLDGVRVYCYDLVERRVYWDRDKSHLWHVHASWIRQFVADMLAASGVLSVLVGEPLSAWLTRTQSVSYPGVSATKGNPEMIIVQAKGRSEQWITNGVSRRHIPNMATVRALESAGVPRVSVDTEEDVERCAGPVLGDVAELKALVADMPQPATADEIAQAVVDQLGGQGAEEAAQALVAAIGMDRAAAIASAVAELVSAVTGQQQG